MGVYEMDCKTLENIPYVPDGHSKDGIGCIGIIWLYLKENGFKYNLRDWNGEKRFEQNPNEFVKKLLTQGEFVPFRQLEKFDICLFSLDRRKVKHAGICTDSGHFLHISESKKSEVQQFNKMWKKICIGGVKLCLR